METLERINSDEIINKIKKENIKISKIIEDALQVKGLTSVDYMDIYKAFGDDFSSLKYKEITIDLNNVAKDVKSKISSILGSGSIFIYIKRK